MTQNVRSIRGLGQANTNAEPDMPEVAPITRSRVEPTGTPIPRAAEPAPPAPLAQPVPTSLLFREAAVLTFKSVLIGGVVGALVAPDWKRGAIRGATLTAAVSPVVLATVDTVRVYMGGPEQDVPVPRGETLRLMWKTRAIATGMGLGLLGIEYVLRK